MFQRDAEICRCHEAHRSISYPLTFFVPLGVFVPSWQDTGFHQPVGLFPRTVFIESGIKAFFEKTLVYPKQIRAKPSKSRGEPG